MNSSTAVLTHLANRTDATLDPDRWREIVRFVNRLEDGHLTMKRALTQITSQAVCCGMDGAEGNEKMLVNCFEIADAALKSLE